VNPPVKFSHRYPKFGNLEDGEEVLLESATVVPIEALTKKFLDWDTLFYEYEDLNEGGLTSTPVRVERHFPLPSAGLHLLLRFKAVRPVRETVERFGIHPLDRSGGLLVNLNFERDEFCTIRRWYVQKERHYARLVGEMVPVEIKDG
jgi:hypothetical protein